MNKLLTLTIAALAGFSFVAGPTAAAELPPGSQVMTPGHVPQAGPLLGPIPPGAAAPLPPQGYPGQAPLPMRPSYVTTQAFLWAHLQNLKPYPPYPGLTSHVTRRLDKYGFFTGFPTGCCPDCGPVSPYGGMMPGPWGGPGPADGHGPAVGAYGGW